jgi:hypothetical protein
MSEERVFLYLLHVFQADFGTQSTHNTRGTEDFIPRGKMI